VRKIILTALLATTLAPGIAQAQDRPGYDQRGDDRRGNDHRGDDRRGDDRRGDDRRGDDRRVDYRGPGGDNRGPRGDDRNRNWGRDDWRGYRDTNRGLYARGNWRAPFRYNAFRPGLRIAPNYFGQQFWISDPWRYRLPPTRGFQRWVRHYDDVLLVDTRRGVVVDVIRGFYR
jgi:Ni/Co efflux regulator RcnB